MTLARRLERLVPALSVRERFLVALREFKADEGISVSTKDLSSAQLQEYQDYARFVVALNNNLCVYAEVYQGQTAFLQSQIATRVAALEEGAAILEEQEGIPREKVSARTLRKKQLSVPTYLRSMAFSLQAELLVDLEELWQGLRAIEIVWAEAAVELGEDPIHTRVRARFDEVKSGVLEVRASLDAKGKAPEPVAELLEQVREVVRFSSHLQVLQDEA